MQHLDQINTGLNLHWQETNGTVFIEQTLATPTSAQQATELAVAVLHRTCAAIAGDHWSPLWVSFRHMAPPSLVLHQEVFGCPIHFNDQSNGIACRADDLQAPNPYADSVMVRYAQQFVDALPASGTPTMALEAYRLIQLTRPNGRATSKRIAQALGMSVRSMQRELDKVGTSFTQILEQVRRERVTDYLANPNHSLMEVSQLLGYSTPNAFGRWFNTQFGMAPRTWRQSAFCTHRRRA